MNFHTAQDTFEPTDIAQARLRKESHARANELAVELFLLQASDQDLDDHIADLQTYVAAQAKSADMARNALAQALNEKSRRASQ